MKKLTILVAMLISSSAFALGHFEKFDFSQAVSPNGYALNEVCYDQGVYVSTVEKSVCASYEEVLADEDQKYELFPRMIKQCASWKKIPAGKVVPATKKGCVEWGEKEVDFDNGDGKRMIGVCIAKGQVEVPRSQRLDVYQDNSFLGAGTIGSEDQLSGSEMYTVPACEASGDASGDLPEEDTPATKKN